MRKVENRNLSGPTVFPYGIIFGNIVAQTTRLICFPHVEQKQDFIHLETKTDGTGVR